MPEEKEVVSASSSPKGKTPEDESEKSQTTPPPALAEEDNDAAHQLLDIKNQNEKTNTETPQSVDGKTTVIESPFDKTNPSCCLLEELPDGSTEPRCMAHVASSQNLMLTNTFDPQVLQFAREVCNRKTKKTEPIEVPLQKLISVRVDAPGLVQMSKCFVNIPVTKKKNPEAPSFHCFAFVQPQLKIQWS